MNDKLTISEDFYSIQGEGISSGFPSYFIRLQNCNLMCGGKDGEHMKSGKATWWCDTEYQWRKGEDRDFDYLIKRWESEDLMDRIATGRIHLIWTGGEPTMPKHQNAIVNFLDYFEDYYNDDKQLQYAFPYNEIETNGTIYIRDELFNRLDQINCSPKLSNSGIDKKYRVRDKVIRRIQEHNKHQFKFVISTEDDVKEIIRDFVEPFQMDEDTVVLMPGLDKQDDFHERTRFVMEMAKKYGFIGLTRMHISAWDATTGV